MKKSQNDLLIQMKLSRPFFTFLGYQNLIKSLNDGGDGRHGDGRHGDDDRDDASPDVD